MAKNVTETENKANGQAVTETAVTETETSAAEVSETAVTETESGETAMPKGKIISGLALCRERYSADGKKYWGYFCEGTMLGKKKRAGFSAPDKDRGGFELLDDIFEGNKSIDIVCVPYEMRDKVTNKITQRGFKYEAFTVASDGLTYSCDIKPRSSSDKSLLGVFLRQKGIEVPQ